MKRPSVRARYYMAVLLMFALFMLSAHVREYGWIILLLLVGLTAYALGLSCPHCHYAIGRLRHLPIWSLYVPKHCRHCGLPLA
ncbi:MAG: hypothetical protein JOY81_07835 [Alphaproteobacteria bacterium]|nr:hypothetical protein [Alphaproteobacteria bacterium]